MTRKNSSVIDILTQIEEAQGTNAKRDILARNKDNETLRSVFVAAYDPYTCYHVSKFKMPKAVEEIDGFDDDDIVNNFLTEVLKLLSTRQVTGNSAKDWVERSFAEMDKRQQKWCQRIILKNLRCGVQDSTINKVWPGTIVNFSVQLANAVKSERTKDGNMVIVDEVTFPVRGEPKLDGLRCVAVKKHGEVTMFTRNGNELDTLPSIKRALEAANFDDVVLDGEAIGKDWNESNSVMFSTKRSKDDSNMTYNVFDALPLDEWVSQSPKSPLKERIEYVAGLMQKLPKGAPIIQVSGLLMTTEEELLSYYASCLDQGYEGIMIKDLECTYCFKRSDAVRKFKPCMTHELFIVDSYEGRRGTKLEGRFGGFKAVAANGIVTKIGGGFSDVARAEIQLAGADSYLGQVIECECQPDPATTDGLTKDGKLRFPVFCRFRDAKDVDPKLISAGCKVLEDGYADTDSE